MTSLIGAAANVIGNAVLIPVFGIMGAAMATFVSYIIIFMARAIHTQEFLKIQWGVLRFVISMAILTAQCYLIENRYTIWSWLCCAVIALLHIRPLFKAVKVGALKCCHPKSRANGSGDNAGRVTAGCCIACNHGNRPTSHTERYGDYRSHGFLNEGGKRLRNGCAGR